MSPETSTERLSEALFGEDHDIPTEYAMCTVGRVRSAQTYSAQAGTACSISVGSISALSRKGGTQVPNEDCLYAFDDGRHVVHIVADGHHGHEASHELVEALAAVYDEHGPLLAPHEALESAYWYHKEKAKVASGTESHPLSPSSARTTLLIACMDRVEGRVQGLSIGDSALFIGSLGEGVSRLDVPTQNYAAPWDYESLKLDVANQFNAVVAPGHWMVSCTDGIHECHYGKPDTSIRSEHLETLMIRASGDTDRFVESLSALALEGVEGHPGGEDNFAILASLA